MIRRRQTRLLQSTRLGTNQKDKTPLGEQITTLSHREKIIQSFSIDCGKELEWTKWLAECVVFIIIQKGTHE